MSETEQRCAISLPEKLDSTAAVELRESLLQTDAADIVIDAGEVQQVGALCLQVLVSADMTFTHEERSFAIANQSEKFAAALELAGIDQFQTHKENLS